MLCQAAGMDFARLFMVISWFPEQLMGGCESAGEGRKMNLHRSEELLCVQIYR